VNTIPFKPRNSPLASCRPDMIVCATEGVVELFVSRLFPGFLWERDDDYSRASFINPTRTVLVGPDGTMIPVYSWMEAAAQEYAVGKIVCAYPVDPCEAWTATAAAIITIALPKNRRPMHPSLENLLALNPATIGYVVSDFGNLDRPDFSPPPRAA
jgi:hypothetical protein